MKKQTEMNEVKIVHTKRRSSRYRTERYHRAYGIQYWLCKNGYCLNEGVKHMVDEDMYVSLITGFINHFKPSEKDANIHYIERTIQGNFNEFKKYVKANEKGK
jgi:hypothetical protein